MEHKDSIKGIVTLLSSGKYGLRLPAAFSRHESLFLKGVIDSFGLMNFIADLQKRFGIKVEKREIHPGNFETMEKIAGYIDKKLAKTAGAGTSAKAGADAL